MVESFGSQRKKMVEDAKKVLEEAKKEAARIAEQAVKKLEQEQKKKAEEAKKKVKKVRKSDKGKHLTVEEKLERKFGSQVVGWLEQFIEYKVEKEVKEELTRLKKEKHLHRKPKAPCH